MAVGFCFIVRGETWRSHRQKRGMRGSLHAREASWVGSVDFVGTFMAMGYYNDIFMEYLLKKSDWNMNGLQYLMEYQWTRNVILIHLLALWSCLMEYEMNINISLVHEILCKKFMYPLFISTWLWKITHLSEVKHHKSSISGQFSIAMLHNQRVKVSDGVISTNVYVYIYI